MELVRKLLIEIGEGISEYNMMGFPEDESQVEESEHDQKLKYHLQIMKQGQLLSFEEQNYIDGTSNFVNVQLTWLGNDFYDSINNNNLWEKAKEASKEKGLELTMLPFDIIISFTKLKAKEILGVDL